jgi:hypothetical protein
MRILLLIIAVLLTGCTAQSCGHLERHIASYSFRTSDLEKQELIQLADRWNEECGCDRLLYYHPAGLSYIGAQTEKNYGDWANEGVMAFGEQRAVIWGTNYYWSMRVVFFREQWQQLDPEMRYILFMHEVGHGLGLLHVEDDPTNVMYPYILPGQSNRGDYWDRVHSWLRKMEEVR